MKKLTVATLIYIGLPTLIFLNFWLKPYLAAISIGAMILAFAGATLALPATDPKNVIPWKEIGLTSLMLSLGICLASEFGVFSYQSYDYMIHNYKFNLLATSSLPLYDAQKGIFMCYYLGNYIVPSLLGKITSLEMIGFYFFLWCLVGIGLTFTWIQLSLLRLSLIKRLAVCLSLVAGAYVCILLPSLAYIFPDHNFMRNNGLFLPGHFILNQVPVFTRSLSESPQHTLPAVLGAAFILAIFGQIEYYRSALFFYFSTLFLTPFTAIGLSGFMIFYFFKFFRRVGFSFFRKTMLYALPLAIAFLPVVFFLASSKATDMASNKAIWQADRAWPLFYLFYLFSFYGIWFLFFGKKLLLFNRQAIGVGLCTVIALAFFQVGFYNDLNIRSALVAQLMLSLSLGYTLVEHWRLMFRNLRFTLGVIFFALNFLGPMKFYYEHLFLLSGEPCNSIESPLVSRLPTNYYDMLESAYRANGKEVVKQYSLSESSFFREFLLRNER